MKWFNSLCALMDMVTFAMMPEEERINLLGDEMDLARREHQQMIEKAVDDAWERNR